MSGGADAARVLSCEVQRVVVSRDVQRAARLFWRAARPLLGLRLGRWQHDLAVDGERLQHDVEVFERGAAAVRYESCRRRPLRPFRCGRQVSKLPISTSITILCLGDR